MSIQTEFFIARPQDIDTIEIANLETNYLVVSARRVDPVKIATLESILLATTPEAAINQLDTQLVRDFGADGPWLWSVNASLVAALADLTPDTVRQYAAQRSATEVWQADKGDPGDLQEFLTQLSQLARRATQEDKGLYGLTSL
jgi:hypothetical protein